MGLCGFGDGAQNNYPCARLGQPSEVDRGVRKLGTYRCGPRVQKEATDVQYEGTCVCIAQGRGHRGACRYARNRIFLCLALIIEPVAAPRSMLHALANNNNYNSDSSLSSNTYQPLLNLSLQRKRRLRPCSGRSSFVPYMTVLIFTRLQRSLLSPPASECSVRKDGVQHALGRRSGCGLFGRIG